MNLITAKAKNIRKFEDLFTHKIGDILYEATSDSPEPKVIGIVKAIYQDEEKTYYLSEDLYNLNEQALHILCDVEVYEADDEIAEAETEWHPEKFKDLLERYDLNEILIESRKQKKDEGDFSDLPWQSFNLFWNDKEAAAEAAAEMYRNACEEKKYEEEHPKIAYRVEIQNTGTEESPEIEPVVVLIRGDRFYEDNTSGFTKRYWLDDSGADIASQVNGCCNGFMFFKEEAAEKTAERFKAECQKINEIIRSYDGKHPPFSVYIRPEHYEGQFDDAVRYPAEVVLEIRKNDHAETYSGFACHALRGVMNRANIRVTPRRGV